MVRSGVHLNYSEDSMLPAGGTAASAKDCCSQCLALSCNAWEWCSRPEGCTRGSVGREGGDISQLSMPHLTCHLLQLREFSPYSFHNQMGSTSDPDSMGIITGGQDVSQPHTSRLMSSGTSPIPTPQNPTPTPHTHTPFCPFNRHGY
jgi:hypothetical protein